LDADDQHNPEDIPALVKPILDDEADVVIGNRRKAPLFRKMGLTVLDASSNVRESQSGFRAYSQKVLKDINVTEDGFGVDSEIIMALKEMGYRIKSVPINISYNRYSHTKNPFSHGFGVLLSIFVKNSALWAGMGIVFSLVSIILLVDVIHTWEVYHELAVGKMIISSILANVGITQFYSGVILYILNKGRLGK
jgi:glycosyltransferase involved in cell wall biosynthesis